RRRGRRLRDRGGRRDRGLRARVRVRPVHPDRPADLAGHEAPRPPAAALHTQLALSEGAQQGFASGTLLTRSNPNDVVPTLNVKCAKLNVTVSVGRSSPAVAALVTLDTTALLRQ